MPACRRSDQTSVERARIDDGAQTGWVATEEDLAHDLVVIRFTARCESSLLTKVDYKRVAELLSWNPPIPPWPFVVEVNGATGCLRMINLLLPVFSRTTRVWPQIPHRNLHS